MIKQELLEILQDWNFWGKELDIGIERKGYMEKCLRILNTTKVVAAIIGVRRAGKSYVMRQTIKKLIENGTDSKNILFVNLEDRRFMEFYPKLLDETYEVYLEILKPDMTPFIFLDEVHNVPMWERWVRTMHELGKAKIVVSGSSSKLLAGELASVLTGRHLDIFVFPLGFGEFLSFRNLYVKDELDVAAKKIELRRYLQEFMEFGGFPEVVLASGSDSKRRLLLTCFDDILTKDIEKRHKLKKSDKLRALARFYFTNIAGTVTFNSLARFLGTSTVTVEKFSSYMEEANIIFFLKRFSFRVKEQENSPRKVYSMDVGLSNAVGFRFSSNLGKLAENLVAVELKKRHSLNPLIEVYYWKNTRGRGEEVDFVVKEDFKVNQLIQVCWDPAEYGTRERELKALLKASEELKCKNLLVITGEMEKEETIKGTKVKFVPLAKWLLFPESPG